MFDEEQQPLLERTDNKFERTRSRLGEFLESKTFHRLIIFLVAVDSACVLADLSHTFLDDTCPPSEEEPEWLTVLSHLSYAITSCFLVEVIVTIFTFGFGFYNPFTAVHGSLHLFDAVVIICTFIIETFLRGRERELASLLIVLRLWRLVKLVEGVAVGVGEVGEGEARQLAEVQHVLSIRDRELADAREEIQDLKSRLSQYE